MLYVLLFISIFFNLILCFIIYRCFDKLDSLENWILDFKFRINNLYNYLKYIDDKNMFEKDDEVGILFEQISDAISSTKNIILDEDDNYKEKNKNQENQY